LTLSGAGVDEEHDDVTDNDTGNAIMLMVFRKRRRSIVILNLFPLSEQ
jgi:hypothetical protein